MRQCPARRTDSLSTETLLDRYLDRNQLIRPTPQLTIRPHVIANPPPELIQINIPLIALPQLPVLREAPERSRPRLVRPLRKLIHRQLVPTEIIQRQPPQRDERRDPSRLRRHLRRRFERLPLALPKQLGPRSVLRLRRLLAASVRDQRRSDAMRHNRVRLRHRVSL